MELHLLSEQLFLMSELTLINLILSIFVVADQIMRFEVSPVFYEKVPLGPRDVVSDVRFSVYTMNEIWSLKF